jgi:hypothetical protein
MIALSRGIYSASPIGKSERKNRICPTDSTQRLMFASFGFGGFFKAQSPSPFYLRPKAT